MVKSEPRALVIGAGGMGRWMARHIWSNYEVWITDIDTRIKDEIGSPYNERYIVNPNYDDYGLIINAVNLSSALNVIRLLKENKFAGTLMDMSSLKRVVNAEMSGLSGTCVSVHPLFGPGAKKLDGKTVLLVPVKDRDSETELSRSIFNGAKIIEIESSAHDELVMHTIQLTHILSIISSRLMVHDRDLLGTSAKVMQYVEAASLYNSSRLIQEMLKINQDSPRLFNEIKSVLDELEHCNVNYKENKDLEEMYEKLYNAIESGCI